MKTYLKVVFSSEGERPSKIHAALAGLGFEPTTGPQDFVYTWPSEADVAEILHFGDLIHEELLGMGALFEMETL